MKLPDTNQNLGAPARPSAGYLRVSSDKQGASIPDQQREIERHAAQNAFEIVKWYIDDAVSGASVAVRDGFNQMLADARAPNRAWTHILAFDVSRLSRGGIDEGGHLRTELRRVGVEVVYTNESLSGGEGDELTIAIKQFMAERYVKDLSRVTIRGLVGRAESGAWSGGCAPYGYDLLYTDSAGHPYQIVRWLACGSKEVYDASGRLIRILPRGERLSVSKQDRAVLVPSTPERITIIARVFHECVELGWGYRAIASGLNSDGVPSPRDQSWSANSNAMWSAATVREVLRNPCYAGDLTWNRRSFGKFHRVKGGLAKPRSRVEASKACENDAGDWIISRDAHKPLVSRTIFDRAQELMKARGDRCADRNFRRGSGLRSPFLLSGLVVCGRCGHRFQGRTVNSTKHRKDGTRIKTLYYACGGWVLKGSSCCQKFVLRKEPIEEVLLEVIQNRIAALLGGEGEAILRQHIEEEIAAQGQNPGRELTQLRDRLAEINHKASVLLEGMSAETRQFVDTKLREFATERRRLEQRAEVLESTPWTAIDPEAVLREGIASFRDLPRLMESASLEERKELIGAFISEVKVQPDEARLDIMISQIPNITTKTSLGMVAGARYTPVQIEMRPLGAFLAGLKRAA